MPVLSLQYIDFKNTLKLNDRSIISSFHVLRCENMAQAKDSSKNQSLQIQLGATVSHPQRTLEIFRT